MVLTRLGAAAVAVWIVLFGASSTAGAFDPAVDRIDPAVQLAVAEAYGCGFPADLNSRLERNLNGRVWQDRTAGGTQACSPQTILFEGNCDYMVNVCSALQSTVNAAKAAVATACGALAIAWKAPPPVREALAAACGVATAALGVAKAAHWGTCG